MKAPFLLLPVFLILFFGCKKREIEPKWRLEKVTQKLSDRIVPVLEFTGLDNVSGINVYPEMGTTATGMYLSTINYQNNKLHSAGIKYKANQPDAQKISYAYNSDGLLIASTTDYLSANAAIIESRKAFFEYNSSQKLKSKSFNSYLSSYEYDLTGNLTKAKLDYDVESKIYEISFDHHDNPFYGIPLAYVFEATDLWGFMSLSKKQITSIKYTEYYKGEIRTSYTINFEYTYDELGRPSTLKQTFGVNMNSIQEFSYYYQ